eukprot:CAMPEP_0197846536 /NCGR_PEP_ID=MMETSP1438-20131217/3390_1 /TAXON_ID=1461541 /ORGANISM="Pterosperma sp., Strain CCMP1384" /LENGTH=654 /DNA_ID=CAMNT_0043458221 /DNA_START=348 /DNA_END=2312 /DNA_ORIENTATION=-
MDDYTIIAGTVVLGGLAALLYKLSTAPQPVKAQATNFSAGSKSNKSSSKSASKKKGGAADKKKKAKKAPEPEPESDPEPEPEPEPEVVEAPSKKKKKKKAAAAPEPEPPAPPPPEPEGKKKKKKGKTAEPPAPEPAPPPAPEPAGKKKKKGKKAETPAPVPEPEPEPEPVWEEASKKKKKKKSKSASGGDAAADSSADAAPAAAAKPSIEDEWTIVEKKEKKKPEPVVLAVEEVEDDGSVTMELGDALGTVIGRGGSTIKHITAESGAKLDIAKGETLVKISGDPEQVKRATTMVQQVLDKRLEELANMHTVVIPVGNKASAVLGKGGCNIRKITTESGAKVDVSCEAGTVTVSGSEEQCAAAQELVKVAIHGEAQEAIDLGQRGVYIIMGPKGATIRQLQEESGARFDIDSPNKKLHISGTKEAVVKAAALARSTLLKHSCELDVSVQDTDIGAVVGKGGVNIKQIQEKSGANVEIQRGTIPGMPSIIKLIGTQEQVAMGKTLVDKFVAREPELKKGEICETMELGGATGLVIGPSGATVKQLQADTGAKVDILRGSGTCKVWGPKAAVAAAKEKIQEKINQFKEREAKQAAAAAATAAAQAQDMADMANGGWDSGAANMGMGGWESAATPGWEPAEDPTAVGGLYGGLPDSW